EAVGRPTGPPGDAVLDAVRRHLADDLDAPGALREVDRWVAGALRGDGDDPAAPALVASTVDALLGIRLHPPR
ncbi:MAG: cysteine--1-D-myo-inosityl 2-amino-2-deoxy-alpha-D-glucopyranoside ligase, partial [Actinomycetes bacterium]